MNKFPVSFYLPQKILDNQELSKIYEDWNPQKMLRKTGIEKRHIAADDEFISDMAVSAAQLLFEQQNIVSDNIDFLILLTQSPDYLLPTTACIVANKLGLPKSVGAFDINLGCSAFVYGLAVAKGLCVANIANNVLVITSEAYTKLIHPLDRSTRTLFGDGAAACIVTKNNYKNIGEFVFGTDGSGFDKLIVPASAGKRNAISNICNEVVDENGYIRTPQNLYMDGTGIFNFSMEVVPQLVNETLKKNCLNIEDIDMFVFHQANKFMLESLRDYIEISPDKFYINLMAGNTVSSTIPIALKQASEENIIKPGDKIMIVGFGVGLSWGAVIIDW